MGFCAPFSLWRSVLSTEQPNPSKRTSPALPLLVCELGNAKEAAGPVFGPKRWRKLLRSCMETIRAERETQTELPKLTQGASLQLQVALEDWAAMFFARCQRAARHRQLLSNQEWRSMQQPIDSAQSVEPDLTPFRSYCGFHSMH